MIAIMNKIFVDWLNTKYLTLNTFVCHYLQSDFYHENNLNQTP